MSTIAKIFTILNVILAAAFVGWAANAVSLNNRFKADLAKEKADRTAAESLLTTEKRDLAAAKNAAEGTVTRLQGETGELKNEIERLKSENKDVEARNAALSADVSKFANAVEEVSKAKDAAHEKAMAAQRAQQEAETAQRAAEDAQKKAEESSAGFEGELRTAKSTIEAKEKELATAEKDRERWKLDFESVVQATGYDKGKIKAMPRIEGKVLAVESSVAPGLVSINRGKNDLVEPGFTFEIFDGSTYKGQARVEYVHANTCSAVLVRKVSGETIRPGDGASTHL